MVVRRRPVSSLALLISLFLVLSPLVAVLAGSGLDRSALFAVLEPEARKLFLDSIEIAAVAALTGLALGGPFALLVAGARSPLRRALLFLALLVLAMPPYLAAAGWIDFMGPVGRVALVLSRLSGGGAEEDARRLMLPGFVYTVPSAGIVLGASYFPLVAFAVAAADRRLDRRLVEVARLGRGRGGVLKTTSSLLGPAALGGALLVFAVALTDFATPMILRVRTLDELLHDQLQEFAFARAAGLGLPLVLVVLAAGGIGAFLAAPRRVASVAGLEGDAPSFALRELTGAGKLLALATGTAALLPGLVFPVLSLVLQARTAPLENKGEGASFARFRVALARAWEVSRDEVVRTVLIAAVSATVALLLAAFAGRLLGRARRREAALTGALAIGLAVPAPLVGLGLIELWNPALASKSGVFSWVFSLRAWVYDGSAVLLLGYLARFLPVAILLARTGFARVPPELEEAAALSGRGRRESARRVVLPLAAPGLVAGWLAIYVLAVAEFGTSVLVCPPGSNVLSVSVVNQVHIGQGPAVAANALLLLLAVALPVPAALVAYVLASRRGGSA